MAQTKHQIQTILSQANAQPLHRFGQNFMIDGNLVRLVAESGQVTPADLVLEVGPGTGTLTEELLERAGRVVAVEIDRNLAASLRNRFGQRDNFLLIEGDAIAGKHQLNLAILSELQEAGKRGQTSRLVANLPYNIASPLVIELLIAGIASLTFTVQKEVADRLRASAGSDDYGPLSAVAQLLARVEVLRTLPPQAFWPAPKVESALVRMVREDRLGADASAFGVFVHAVFSYRRKMLRKALSEAGYDADAILAATHFDGRLRPEEFTPDQLLTIYRCHARSTAT